MPVGLSSCASGCSPFALGTEAATCCLRVWGLGFGIWDLRFRFGIWGFNCSVFCIQVKVLKKTQSASAAGLVFAEKLCQSGQNTPIDCAFCAQIPATDVTRKQNFAQCLDMTPAGPAM